MTASVITPREPLTVTELETLAVMLNSAGRAMRRAKIPGRDAWAWSTPGDAQKDFLAGFYDLARGNPDPYTRLVFI